MQQRRCCHGSLHAGLPPAWLIFILVSSSVRPAQQQRVECQLNDRLSCRGRRNTVTLESPPAFADVDCPGESSLHADKNDDVQPFDWDGDGFVDLVIWRANRLLYYKNNANQGFSQLEGLDNPFEDVDAYGMADIRGRPCSSYNHMPGGEIGLNCTVITAPGFAVGDWDGDGHPDVLVGNGGDPDNSNNTVRFFRNNGTGGLLQELHGHPFVNLTLGPTSIPLGVRRLQAVDLDRDGDLDLLVNDIEGYWNTTLLWADPYDQKSVIRLFEREGVGGPLVEVLGEESPLASVQTAVMQQSMFFDFDQDGDGDLLVVALDHTAPRMSYLYQPPSLVLYTRNDGGRVSVVPSKEFSDVFGSLIPERRGGGLVLPSVHLVDWHRDGIPDLLVFDCGATYLYSRTPIDESLVEQTGVDNPLRNVLTQHKSRPQVIDVDNDGVPEIVTLSFAWSNEEAEEYPLLTYHKGTATLGYSLVDLAESPLQNFSFLSDPEALFDWRIFLVDWNNDGWVDVLVKDKDGHVRVHEALVPAGHFDAVGRNINLTLDRGIHLYSGSFQAVDWDGDGDLDVLHMPDMVYNTPWGSSNGDSRLDLWEQVSLEAFERRQLFLADNNTVPRGGAFQAIDWDFDGDLDLLFVRHGKMFFFERLSSGRLLQKPDHPVALLPLRGGMSTTGYGADVHMWATDLLIDGEMVLLQGTDSDTSQPVRPLELWRKGWCALSDPCSGAGICDARGQCRCLEGQDAADCSSCSPGYYSSEDGLGDVRICARCPYSNLPETRGTCSNRGVCNDDFDAAEQRKMGGKNISSLRLASAKGTGECLCNRRFSGELCEQGECPPGEEYVLDDQLELFICRKCPAGKAKSEDGDGPCSECSPGRFRSSATLATGICEPCAEGRYTTDFGADSSEACRLCEKGKWSQTAGASQPGACLPCPAYTMTEEEGATAIESCLRPAEDQVFDCVAGRHCQVKLQGNLSRRMQHQLGVFQSCNGTASDVVDGVPGEGVSLVAKDSGTLYEWSDIFRSNGGSYALCWCAGWHLLTCTGVSTIRLAVGYLNLRGPFLTQGEFVAVRTVEPTQLGPVRGLTLLSDDLLIIAEHCEVSPTKVFGVEEAAVAESNGELTATFAHILSPPGSYSLCWSSNDDKGFAISVGPLRLEGPLGGQQKNCYVGQHCIVAPLTGTNLKAGDQLMLSLDCERILDGVPGGGVSTAGAGGKTFAFGNANETLGVRTGIYVMCWRRPPRLRWVDTGVFTARGPFGDLVATCELGSSCSLSAAAGQEFRGLGLSSSDRLLLLHGKCGDGQRLDSRGFAGWQLPLLPAADLAGANSLAYDLGWLPMNATPGEYEICWCSGSSSCTDTANFMASAGQLRVVCPPGRYVLNSLTAQVCALCPRGSFCKGGLPANAIREPCPGGQTTETLGEINNSACACRRGFEITREECTECVPGRFKATISSSQLCETCPGESTTFGSGATSEAACLVPTREDTSSFWRVTVDFSIEHTTQSMSTLVGSGWPDFSLNLRLAVVRSTTVPLAQVQVQSARRRLDATISGANANGNVSQGHWEFRFIIDTRSWPETEDLAADLQAETFLLEVSQSAGGRVQLLSEPSVGRATVICDPRKSPPPGVPILSKEECVCDVGYYFDVADSTCEMCPLGWYKDTASNDPCEPCPSVGSETGFTLGLGSNSSENCLCPPGWFGPRPTECQACGEDFYCTGGTNRTTCKPGSSTGVNNYTVSAQGCWCEAGFGLQLRNQSSTLTTCEPCEPGTFKETRSDQTCDAKCHTFATTDVGATSRLECRCLPNYYFEDNGCAMCPSAGVTCSGGFHPNSYIHREPESLSGFYMVGLARAVSCSVKAGNSKGELVSVCLAGANRQLTRTREQEQLSTGVCTTGHMGLVCGACATGYARDENGVECEDCTEAGGDWLLISCMVGDGVFQVIYAAFVTQLSSSNAEDNKRLDTIFIRLFTQWMSVMAVLANFDYSSVGILDWSHRFASADSTILSDFSIKWPPMFHDAASVMFQFQGYLPSVVPPQQALQCVLLRRGFSRRAVEDASSLYWFLYPVTNGIFLVALMLFAAKVIHPGREWLRATQKLQSTLAKTLTRLLGISDPLAKKMISLMSEDELQAAIQSPREYLQDVEHLWSTFGEQLARQIVTERLLKTGMRKSTGRFEVKESEVRNLCVMCDKDCLILAGKQPSKASKGIQQKKGAWALAWAKAGILAELQALQVADSCSSATALSTAQRCLADLHLPTDCESEESELRARVLDKVSVPGLVSLHRLALLGGQVPPAIVAGLHCVQRGGQACLSSLPTLRRAAPVALKGDITALLEAFAGCSDTALMRLGCEGALTRAGCPASLAGVAAQWLVSDVEVDGDARADELSRLCREGARQLHNDEDVPVACRAGPLLCKRLLQLGCGQSLAAAAAEALQTRCSRELLPSLALVLGCRREDEDGAGTRCCMLRALKDVVEALGLGSPCQTVYAPALRHRLLRAGATPALADAAEEALTDATFSAVEQNLEHCLFGDAGAAVHEMNNVLRGLGLDSSFHSTFLVPAVCGRMASLGCSVVAVQSVRHALAKGSCQRIWPELGRLIFKMPTLQLLTSLAGELGVEDTLKDVVKPLLQKSLVILGAGAFHAGTAAALLTPDVYSRVQPTLQELLFGGEGRHIELLLEVFGELYADSDRSSTAAVTEEVLRPALQVCIRRLGGSRTLASRMSAGLTCNLVEELHLLLEQVLYSCGGFGLEALEALILRLGSSTLEECLCAFSEAAINQLGFPLVVASAASTQVVTQALPDPAGRNLLENALLPRNLVCGQRFAALQELLQNYSSLGSLSASTLRSSLNSRLVALRPCTARGITECGRQKVLAARLASTLSESEVARVRPALERLLWLPMEAELACGRGVDALVAVFGLDDLLPEFFLSIFEPSLGLDATATLQSPGRVLSSLETLLFSSSESLTASLLHLCNVLQVDPVRAGLQPALKQQCLSLGFHTDTAISISQVLEENSAESIEKVAATVDCLFKPAPQVGLVEALRQLLRASSNASDTEVLLQQLLFSGIRAHGCGPQRFSEVKRRCEEQHCLLPELEPVLDAFLSGDPSNILAGLRGLCDVAGCRTLLWTILLPQVLWERLQRLRAPTEVLACSTTFVKQMEARNLHDALASLLFGTDGALEVLHDIKDMFVLEDEEEELIFPALTLRLEQMGVSEGEIHQTITRLSHMGVAEERPALGRLLLGKRQGWHELQSFCQRFGVNLDACVLRQSEDEANETFEDSDTSALGPDKRHWKLQELAILGLFTDASFRSVCVQCVPIFIVMLYNLWMPVSIRLLAAVACDTFELEDPNDYGSHSLQSRWLGDTTQECIPKMSARAGFATAGLTIWSGGFLIVLYFLIRRYKEELMDPSVSRRYGYFYVGFQPKHWWWELGVKRVDTLLVMVITYTSIVQNPYSKLIAYMVIAGICWAGHNAYKPFDDRENGVLNRFESSCLRTRFLTFAVITTLLLSAEIMHKWLVVSLAAALLFLNGYFILCFFLAIGAALFDNVNVLAPFMKKHGGTSGLDKTAMLKRIFITVSRFALRRVLRVLLRIVTLAFRIINGEKDDMKEQAPRFLWQGGGMPLKVIDCRRYSPPLNVCRRLPLQVLQFFVSSFYGLSYAEQTSFMVKSLGKIYIHLLSHAHFKQLPVSVDSLCLITLSLMRIQQEESASEGSRHLSVEEAMVDVLEKAEQRLRRIAEGRLLRDATRQVLTPHFLEESAADKLDDLERELCFTAEDLHVTVMHLHNLHQCDTTRLFDLACDEVLRRHALNREVTRLDVRLTRLFRQSTAPTRSKTTL